MTIKRLYIITGTSSGIGKSMVELLSSDEENYIIGISRNDSIRSANYHHLTLDLSVMAEVKAMEMPEFDSLEAITLINNAGIIGEIRPLNKLSINQIEETIQVNYTSAMILATKFIQQYQALEIKNKTIINISSGAATSPYGSWANYCSSKAALEMLTKCINKEQESMEFPIQAFAIAPGVVDTNMQKSIRNSNLEDFAMKPKFIELFEENQLYSPMKVAERIIDVSLRPENYQESIFRVIVE